MTKFYTESELMRMPISRVRNLDIRDSNEEALVQKVVDIRVSSMPLPQAVNRRDVPDIKTVEEEAKWQKVVDERETKARLGMITAELEPPTSPEATPEEVPQSMPTSVPDGTLPPNDTPTMPGVYTPTPNFETVNVPTELTPPPQEPSAFSCGEHNKRFEKETSLVVHMQMVHKMSKIKAKELISRANEGRTA